MARQANRLTVAQVRAAKPGIREDGSPKQRVMMDGHGLMLRVMPSGSKQWVQRITVRGRRVDMGLGGVDLVTLAEAREAAFENRKIARSGGDPRRPKQPTVPTFAEAQAFVLEQKRPTWKTRKAAHDWEASMRAHVLPKIGRLPVGESDITSREIYDLLLPLVRTGKGAAAKALVPRLNATFQWAIVQGHRVSDPVKPAVRNLPKRKNGTTKHHPSLPWDEVGPALARFDDGTSEPWTKLAIRLTALTASRPGEVREATWSEIDFDNAVWNRPATHMKAGKEHRVPLSTQALDVLRQMRQLSPRTALIFATSRGRPLSASTMGEAMRQTEFGASPHGFRSSFKGWARDHDVDERVSEFALAHVEKAVVAAYARDDLLDKRRPVMQAYADAIT